MEIIDRLSDIKEWEALLSYKQDGGHISRAKEKDLSDFIQSGQWKEIAKKIQNNEPFSHPKITELNKKHASKKRIVFTFERDESYALKLITYMLGEYDELFSPNLYSFRRTFGVKRAISDILGRSGINQMYSFKADISDYFNSVNYEKLLFMLKRAIKKEDKLIAFLTTLLSDPYAVRDSQLIKAKKGIMAGVPVSAFLANVYLAEMDKYFYETGAVYARYSDDIIIFAKSKEELGMLKRKFKEFINSLDLDLNEKKVVETGPNEPWEFLGFKYDSGDIDVGEVAIDKIKGKMKRKARALYRWKNKKNADNDRAIKAFVRYYNKKFFNNSISSEITWCRWYFPVITTDKGLKEIDRYVQDCIRFIAAGNYSASRFKLKYEDIRSLGYRSLVNKYYAFRQGKYEPVT